MRMGNAVGRGLPSGAAANLAKQGPCAYVVRQLDMLKLLVDAERHTARDTFDLHTDAQLHPVHDPL